jgi:hypothetical protein
MKLAPFLVAAVWVASFERPSLAYRPFDSTDAAVAAAGYFELELGPLGYFRQETRGFLVVPGFIANIGFYRNWEVVLQGRHFVLLDEIPGEPRLRLVETGAFLKGVVREGTLQGKSGPSVGIELGALLPTVNGDPGTGATLITIVSQRWSAATLHVNVAPTLSRAHNFDLFAGAILEGPYEWVVRPVLEIFVDREFSVSTSVSGLVGAIWRVTNDLSLDVAFRLARLGDLSAQEVRVGLTWAFPLVSSR